MNRLFVLLAFVPLPCFAESYTDTFARTLAGGVGFLLVAAVVGLILWLAGKLRGEEQKPNTTERPKWMQDCLDEAMAKLEAEDKKQK